MNISNCNNTEPKITEKNKLWVIDFMTVRPPYDNVANNLYLVTIIDAFSKFIIKSQFLAKKSTKGVASILKKVTSSYGIPKLLYWDKPESLSVHAVFKHCEQNNIKFIHSDSNEFSQHHIIANFYCNVYLKFAQPIMSPFSYSVSELNTEWQIWLKEHQHSFPIKESPVECYLQSLKKKGTNINDSHSF